MDQRVGANWNASACDVYLNFVNGQWKQGSSGQWDTNRNPARPTEIFGKATRSTPMDVERALDAAANAQAEWARRPRPARGAILAKAAQILRGKLDTHAKTVTREQGKSLNEARAELQKAVQMLEFHAAEARRAIGQVLPSETAGRTLHTLRAARGVVVAITPWTQPVAVPVSRIAPALLEGNTVVFKPSSLTPASASMLVRIFEEAGLPAGCLNLVYGSGATLGQTLLMSPKTRAVTFAGSHEIAKEVTALAAKRMIPAQVETGGKNSVVVLADADLDRAVEATVQGAFGSTGQRASAISRVIVESSILDAFREKLLARVRAIKVGDGMQDPASMGPLADDKVQLAFLESVENAKKEGARLLCGGERVGVAAPETGYFVAPTVFDEVRGEMRIAREEIVGPLLALIAMGSADDAIRAAQAVDTAVTSAIYTRDAQKALSLAERLGGASIHVNATQLQDEAHATGRATSTTSEFYFESRTLYLDT